MRLINRTAEKANPAMKATDPTKKPATTNSEKKQKVTPGPKTSATDLTRLFQSKAGLFSWISWIWGLVEFFILINQYYADYGSFTLQVSSQPRGPLIKFWDIPWITFYVNVYVEVAGQPKELGHFKF